VGKLSKGIREDIPEGAKKKMTLVREFARKGRMKFISRTKSVFSIFIRVQMICFLFTVIICGYVGYYGYVGNK